MFIQTCILVCHFLQTLLLFFFKKKACLSRMFIPLLFIYLFILLIWNMETPKRKCIIRFKSCLMGIDCIAGFIKNAYYLLSTKHILTLWLNYIVLQVPSLCNSFFFFDNFFPCFSFLCISLPFKHHSSVLIVMISQNSDVMPSLLLFLMVTNISEIHWLKYQSASFMWIERHFSL